MFPKLFFIFLTVLLFATVVQSYLFITQGLQAFGIMALKQIGNAFITSILEFMTPLGVSFIASLPATTSAMISRTTACQPQSINPPLEIKSVDLWRPDTGVFCWASSQQWSINWVLITLVVTCVGIAVTLWVSRKAAAASPQTIIDKPAVCTTPSLVDEASVDLEDEDPIIAPPMRNHVTRNSTAQRSIINSFPQFNDNDTASESSDTTSICSDDSQDSNTTITPITSPLSNTSAAPNDYDLTDPFINDSEADTPSIADSQASYTAHEDDEHVDDEDPADSPGANDPPREFYVHVPDYEDGEIVEEFITPRFTWRRTTMR